MNDTTDVPNDVPDGPGDAKDRSRDHTGVPALGIPPEEPPRAPLDRVRVTGIRGRGRHGVFEFERREGQEFVVDLELAVDLASAGASDDLGETVDYGAVASSVLARIEGEPYDLVERLAEVVAADALAHPAVDEVTVTVHKPQAPVAVPFGDVAVSVVRRRAPVPVVVALGANLARDESSPEGTIAAAVDRLELDAGLRGVRVSACFDTEPVGGPDQPDFVNAVLVGRTSSSPASLLRQLHAVEARFGRVRDVRWGPRTLDLDLVQYGDPRRDGDVRNASPRLTLPHPRAHERAFVLVPWLDVDPDAVLRQGDSIVAVADLAGGVDSRGVRRRPGDDDGSTTR
ncbi:MAG: 2-amino-4-hydroxy-6-hydroxymethyldihydropteridine diphosphokinase [Phycicoccus sp.]